MEGEERRQSNCLQMLFLLLINVRIKSGSKSTCLRSVSFEEQGPGAWEAPVGPEGHKRFSVALFKLMLFPILNKGDAKHPPSTGSAL